MKQHHFVQPAGPMGQYAQGYREHLVAAGYAFGTVQRLNSQLAEVSRFLEQEALDVIELDEAVAARFAAWRTAKGRVGWTSPLCLRVLLTYLRGIDAIPPQSKAGGGPFNELLDDYRRYLTEERGLASKTVAGHLNAARRLCSGVAESADQLGALRAADVTRYLLSTCSAQSAEAAKATARAASVFLRFLHLSAVTPRSLCAAVPKLPTTRPAASPAELSTEQLSRLLESCDRRTTVGRRNYAILVTFSRLGLRACEVMALSLEDIDWRHGELIVRGKANRHERLPLPHDVGEAIAAYLERGRPRPSAGCRSVFLRTRAPFQALGLAGVQTVVRDASVRAGIGIIGPRRLRQHAASTMQHAGLSLGAVAQVLRQRNLRVTARYVSLEKVAVAELARPWPGATR